MATFETELNEETASEDIPTVMLNVDEISHHMAARLTGILLGHLLYMKGQVPFPVNSLERMSSQRHSGDLPPRDNKTAKRRKEFVDAYDDLRSHLETTFVALSTAYAHNTLLAVSTRELTSSEGETMSHLPNYRSATIHLLLVLGSSLTLPKARVLLELNGFHVEKFGEREFIIRQLSKASSKSDDESSEDDDDDEDVNETSNQPAESDNEEAANNDNTSDTEEVDSKQFFSVPSTPRRTASFYTASASPSSEPPDTPSSGMSESSEELGHSSPETSLSEDQIATLGVHSIVEDDSSSRECERVFSKALLRFGEALGFEDELAPTQTHILIRAPRRFSHPTWVPRQTLTPSLDKIIGHLTAPDGGTTKNNNKTKKSSGNFGFNVPIVGLRVVCQSVSTHADCDDSSDNKNNVDDAEEEELDELIWWCWDGKLVGFSD